MVQIVRRLALVLLKLAYCFSQHCFREKDINCELSRKRVGKEV